MQKGFVIVISLLLIAAAISLSEKSQQPFMPQEITGAATATMVCQCPAPYGAIVTNDPCSSQTTQNACSNKKCAGYKPGQGGEPGTGWVPFSASCAWGAERTCACDHVNNPDPTQWSIQCSLNQGVDAACKEAMCIIYKIRNNPDGSTTYINPQPTDQKCK